MRSGDLFREVFYPMLVASLIGTVWCVAKYMPGGLGSADSERIRYYTPLDPALSHQALMAGEASAGSTTAPTRVTSIDPAER